jgi:hypothetical protein
MLIYGRFPGFFGGGFFFAIEDEASMSSIFLNSQWPVILVLFRVEVVVVLLGATQDHTF